MPQLSQPSQKIRPKVVAAIPCFNTEYFIGDVVSTAKNYVDHVIVIDDGSYDGSAEAARAAGAQVINHGTNRGYGEAIKSCFETVKANAADILVIIDGDGQHNPDEIPKLVTPILNGEADVVIGSRFLQPIQSAIMPSYRKFGISVITLLFNLGSKTKVSDAQSGFRAYNRKAFTNLPLSERGMSASIESLEEARRRGAIIREVVISCSYVSSTLNLKAIKHGLGVALSVVRIRLKHCLFGGSKRSE